MKRTNLIDDAGTLRDQPLAHAMQRLQVQLLGRLGRNELHRGPLHRLGDRLRVAEVVLLSLRIRANVLCRHQPDIMPECLELPAQMMRTNAGLHADQARCYVGEPRCHLPARPLLAQRDRTPPVEANHVEGVLADINADYGDLDAGLISSHDCDSSRHPRPAALTSRPRASTWEATVAAQAWSGHCRSLRAFRR
jgi:hypothetical protein